MKKRFYAVLITATFGFFLLIITTSCTLLGLDSQTREVRSLQKSVDEITDGGFKVPLHEDYPLVSAYVSYPPFETGINIIELFYSVEKIELEYLFGDEAMKEMAEEQSKRKYLYGPYRGEGVIWLQYWPSPGRPSVASDGVERRSWIINGQEVIYDYMSRGWESVMLTMTIGKGGLHVYYRLDERFTEEDAEVFTKYLMDFYQIETQY